MRAPCLQVDFGRTQLVPDCVKRTSRRSGRWNCPTRGSAGVLRNYEGAGAEEGNPGVTVIGQIRSGAIVATIGIFLPSFILVAASRPLIPRIRRSPIAGPLLDGVNVGALALMAAVTVQLSRAALVDATTAAVAAISALVLIYSRMNSAWLIFAAGLVGFAATRWLGR